MAKHQPSNLTKPCQHCGQPITWRKGLASTWQSIKYCSNACTRLVNRQRRQQENAATAHPTSSPKRPR